MKAPKAGKPKATISQSTIITDVFSQNWVHTIIGFLFSCICGLIASKYGWPVFESFVTGVLSFISFEFFCLNYNLSKLKFEQKETSEFWNEITEYTTKFEKMNVFMYKILERKHGESDLFVEYSLRAIDDLYTMLRSAAEGLTIVASSDYLVNASGVFDALNATNERVVKLTYPIRDNAPVLASPEDRRFFEAVFEMLTCGKIEKVEILVILENVSQLADYGIKELFSFYSSNNKTGYEAKYVLLKDFESIHQHTKLPYEGNDFGIYGPEMLFIVDSNTPNYSGSYYKDAEIVSRYARVFDDVWKSEYLSHRTIDEVDDKGKTPADLFALLDCED